MEFDSTATRWHEPPPGFETPSPFPGDRGGALATPPPTLSVRAPHTVPPHRLALLITWLVALMLLAAARAHATPVVRAVRQITSPATTRLIVELSEPAHFRLERSTARPELGIPPRLYVDLLDTRLNNPGVAAVALPQGPALRVRAAEHDGSTTRLILDVPGLSEFGAFPMLDPFRLIIDVRGTPRLGTPASVPADHTLRADAPHGGAQPPTPAVAQPQRPVPTQAKQQSDTVVASVPRSSADRQRPPPPAVPPGRLKIVLDPGHGGKDPGAIGVGAIAEKDIVLAIALQLRDRLQVAGFNVVLTRDSDVFIPLEERTARANAEQADLFVSIHGNASPNPRLSGVETYYLNNTNDRATIRLAEMENGLRAVTGGGRGHDVSLILSDLIQSYKIEESVSLAEQLQKAVVADLGAQGWKANDLGVKRGPFYVLVGAGMPCVLVEVSFLTHPEEAARLAQPGYQQAIAAGLLRGIQRFVENTRVVENL
ncbi:MAG TPA: N-acetylmuramoyl-L-alanine amidase [Candidatus Margulisiibacteriota bacterium]|nr:N-acetylmuramoyl-L-alanine amidase [Candidatus Margulisiibacteriota bacterium]